MPCAVTMCSLLGQSQQNSKFAVLKLCNHLLLYIASVMKPLTLMALMALSVSIYSVILFVPICDLFEVTHLEGLII
jgi:uncharacterized membrane protein (DUF106 family)